MHHLQAMQAIQMVDLKSQYLKIKDQVDQSIQQVIESGAFINGPTVTSFQNNLADYLGASHVLGCGNGTDALQIALMALDLKPGDEVITTPFTFVATAEVIALLGLEVVFVDVEPDTFNIDVSQIEQAITGKTRCIIPVHLFGQACNMDALMALSAKHDLYVIEDNAQAIGGSYTFDNGTTQKTGTIGHIGCTSFYPSKNLGCYGDGGAVNCSDDTLFDKIKAIGNHGSSRRYYYDAIGVNSRLDSIQAAVLDIKLQYLDDYVEARRILADAYDKALGRLDEVTIPTRLGNAHHVFHQYTLKVANRDALKSHLQENGIPSMVYYPKPLHLHEPYKSDRNRSGAFPVTEQLANEVISLPMHTEMSTDQIEHITNCITQFYSKAL